MMEHIDVRVRERKRHKRTFNNNINLYTSNHGFSEFKC